MGTLEIVLIALAITALASIVAYFLFRTEHGTTSSDPFFCLGFLDFDND